jgi:hypothetical protein
VADRCCDQSHPATFVYRGRERQWHEQLAERETDTTDLPRAPRVSRITRRAAIADVDRRRRRG